MTGLVLVTCDRAFAPGGDAPEWVHLLSERLVTGRDGRDFDLQDPAALILAFQSSGIDLPIDYKHQSENADAKANGPVPAAGWIKELKLESGKLWGRVDWTATAREMIPSAKVLAAGIPLSRPRLSQPSENQGDCQAERCGPCPHPESAFDRPCQTGKQHDPCN